MKMRERRDELGLFDYMHIPYRNKTEREQPKTTNVHWLQKLAWIVGIAVGLYTLLKGVISL